MTSELREFSHRHYRAGVMTAAKDERQDWRNMADLINQLAQPAGHAAVILADITIVLNLFSSEAGNRILFELTPEEHWPTLRTALAAVDALMVVYAHIPVNEAFQQEINGLGKHSRYRPNLRY